MRVALPVAAIPGAPPSPAALRRAGAQVPRRPWMAARGRAATSPAGGRGEPNHTIRQSQFFFPIQEIFVNRDQLLASASMPLASPSYPRGPYRFINREYFIVTYESDPQAIRDA